MRLIWCLFALSILLHSSDGSSIDIQKRESKAKSKKIFLDWFVPKEKPIKSNTSLSDLSSELELIILEFLDFPDLLTMALSNARYSYLAADVFRRKFSHYAITLAIREIFPKYAKPMVPKVHPKTFFGRFKKELKDLIFMDDIQKFEYVSTAIRVIDETIEIYDFKLSKRVLKLFGKDIRHLTIDGFRTKVSELRTISELISEHCADSLIRFNITTMGEHLLPMFARPFPKVEEFSFSIHDDRVASGIPPFNRIFLNVRILNMEFLFGFNNFHFVELELPRLDQLKVESATQTRANVESYLERFMLRNQHIRSLELINISPDYVNVVHRCLPKLQALSLTDLDIQNDLHFDSIKLFRVMKPPGPGLAHLFFSNLEEIFITYNDLNELEWRTFFQNHQHLRRLHFDEIFIADNVHMVARHVARQFDQLTAILPNLESISATLHTAAISVDSIAEIFARHPKLQRFDFTCKYFRGIKLYFDRFEDEWDIRYIKSNTLMRDGLVLQRKNTSGFVLNA